MRKRVLSIVLIFCMVLGLMPTVFADDTVTPAAGTAIIQGSDTVYDTLADAIKAARSGDTIQLGVGTYSTYGAEDIAKGKNLTFVGFSIPDTKWTVGPTDEEGVTDYADGSLAGAGTVSFEALTLETSSTGGVGFTGIQNTSAFNVEIDGKTTVWGEESARFITCSFRNTTEDEEAYLLKTGATREMTFSNCEFYTNQNVISASGDADEENTYVLNVIGCSKNGTGNRICVIDDSNRSYKVNFSSNTILQAAIDERTCSFVYWLIA